MNYVILGAGPAGVTAAETIRQVDKTGSITLIGGEPEPPYSRMAIPYLLAGNINEHGTFLRQDDKHYDKSAIVYKMGRVGGVDTVGKKLYMSGGETLAYDKLLIATGASPIIPRMDGSNLDGVHTCWTLADARAMLKLASKGAPVVLVGAGFIGSIVLEALHKMGCDITVVEIAPRMVARMLDETAGNMLGRWSTAKGVKVYTNTKVERITGGSGANGAKLFVGLSNGTSVPASLVVMAAGVKSNTGFLVGSGVKTNWGVAGQRVHGNLGAGRLRRRRLLRGRRSFNRQAGHARHSAGRGRARPLRRIEYGRQENAAPRLAQHERSRHDGLDLILVRALAGLAGGHHGEAHRRSQLQVSEAQLHGGPARRRAERRLDRPRRYAARSDPDRVPARALAQEAARKS